MEKAHRYSGVRLHLIFILLFVVMQFFLPDWVNALFWIMYRMLGSLVHICRFASIDVSRHYIIPFGYIGTMFRDINDYCKVPFWFFLLILLFWVAMLLTTSNHFWIYEFDWQSFGHPWASISSLYFVKPWCYKLDLVLDCWPKQSRINNILISLYYGIRQTWK